MVKFCDVKARNQLLAHADDLRRFGLEELCTVVWEVAWRTASRTSEALAGEVSELSSAEVNAIISRHGPNLQAGVTRKLIP